MSWLGVVWVPVSQVWVGAPMLVDLDCLNARYNLHSMYAERATDVLLFQKTKQGLQLLESDFARQWRSEIERK